MGLDMYLSAKKWVDREGDVVRNVTQSLFPELDDQLPIKAVIVEAAYWRKANHIHNWFVTTVQNGKDDCGTHYVSREKLEELLLLCEQVLKRHEKGQELLPTTSGFFFGSTDYNDWYFESLEETLKQIKRCLELPLDWDFEYESSW